MTKKESDKHKNNAVKTLLTEAIEKVVAAAKIEALPLVHLLAMADDARHRGDVDDQEEAYAAIVAWVQERAGKVPASIRMLLSLSQA